MRARMALQEGCDQWHTIVSLWGGRHLPSPKQRLRGWVCLLLADTVLN